MDDIDALFTGNVVASAVDTFTDRVPQAEAFSDAVLAHSRRLRADPDVDIGRARDNVLTYYGIGGLGKTSLSERLEDWIIGELPDDQSWGPPPQVDRPILTTRLDMGRHRGLDLENAVLELRATAGALLERAVTFDLAFAYWWQRVHGDAALPSLPVRWASRSPVTTRDVGDQLKDSVADVIQDLGLGFGIANFGIRVTERIHDAISRRAELKKARSSRAFVAMMARLQMSAGLTELSQLPLLIGEELRGLPPETRPLWIVFVDTFEHVNGNRRREGERELQRMVIGVPDALWVFSGRERLDWAGDDRIGGLDRAGPIWWPGLDARASTPRQHLVGDLSDTDARWFLTRALSDLPVGAVPGGVVEVILRRAAGWPLYLDSAVRRIRELIANGVQIQEETFDVNFAALVDRAMRDLPDEECAALLWACVFPRFSVQLVVEAALGQISEASILRLRQKGLLLERPWPRFALTVHDALRREVRNLAPEQQGLTDRDWTERAQRAVVTLEHHFDRDHGRDARIDTFNLAMSVALEHDLAPEWLVAAATALPTMHDAANATPGISTDVDATWVGHLVAVLACWTDSAPATRGTLRADLLRQVVEERDLPTDLREFALRFCAYSLRNHGHDEEALEIFDRLLAEGVSNTELHHRQRCLVLGRLGRFREINEELRAAVDLDADASALRSVEAYVDYFHGRLADARDGYMRRAVACRADGRERLARQNLGDAAMASSLMNPVKRDDLFRFRDECAAVAQDNTFRAACCAVALASAGTPGFAEAAAELDAAFDLPPPAGEHEHASIWRIPLARAFDAAVRGDLATLDEHRSMISTHRIWWVVTGFWRVLCGGDDIHEGATVEWIEPADDVARRWRSVAVDRRHHVGRDESTGRFRIGSGAQ